MNEVLADARFWITALGAAVVGFVKYLWSRQEKRLDKLEGDTVRRAEFDRLREDFDAKHEENGEKIDSGFARIEALIERNHKDAIDGRHRAANQVLTLVEKVGKIEGRLGLDEFSRREG